MKIVMYVEATGVDSPEDRDFAVKKAIKSARKIDMCIDLTVWPSRRSTKESEIYRIKPETYLIKPNDSLERVYRRVLLQDKK